MNKIFIDCGAHCGESILEAKRRFGNDIKIISFEANPNLAIPLQNHFKDDLNVEVRNEATWIEDQESTSFYLSVDWSDGSSIYKEKKSGGISDNISVNIPSINLANFIKKIKKDNYIILKLDVEGAEYEILNHLIEEDVMSLVDEFHGEFHPDKIDKPELKDLETKIFKHFNDNKINFHNWELVGNQPKAIDRNVWKNNINIEPITFVIPSRNNLEFLKLAYKSIKNLKGDHEILVLNDASTDGTQEWIESINDSKLITHHNEGPDRIGIVGMFDKGIEMANTDIIMAFHADMVAAPHLDEHILKNLKKGTVVSATRVEPPLHPDGPEKMLVDFGIEVEDFNMDDFNNWVLNDYKPKPTDGQWMGHAKVTEGIFAPWCMYKDDFLAIGGHDKLFAPQSKEDSDLFNRFVLNGYKVLQTWDGLVYHFTSRGSRFNKHAGGAAGQNSEEWLHTTNKNMRNFIRKWGTMVKHDSLMKPIISPKYDIAFRVTNNNLKLIEALEPWCNVYYGDGHWVQYEHYIAQEQLNTKFNMRDRIKTNDSTLHDFNHGVIVEIDGHKIDNQDFQMLQILSEILEEGGEIGEFELGNMKVIIKDLTRYENNLIICE